MDELDPAHVEAVAGCLVSDHDCYHCLTHEDWSIPVEGGPCQTGREQAKKMLTSTDPDVHAALLAALVRAGVLDRDDRVRAEGAADGIEGLMHELDCARDARLAALRADQWRAQARATGADQ